jgi:hypothetical protein
VCIEAVVIALLSLPLARSCNWNQFPAIETGDIQSVKHLTVGERKGQAVSAIAITWANEPFFWYFDFLPA